MPKSKEVEDTPATKKGVEVEEDEIRAAVSAIFEQMVKESEDDRAAIFFWITSDRKVVDLTPSYYSQGQLKVLADAGAFEETEDPKSRIWAHADPDLPQIMFTFEINMRVLLALAAGAVPVGAGTYFTVRFVKRLCDRIAENLADALGDKASNALVRKVSVLKASIQERIRESEAEAWNSPRKETTDEPEREARNE